MRKTLLVVTVIALGLTAQLVNARDVQELYNKSCIACHATGAAGAPKTGDATAWTSRLAKGIDVLVGNARTGYKAMPPKGMCMDCTDEELKGLITLMSAAK